MQVIADRIPAEEGQSFPILLASDFHLGAQTCDVKRLVADLDQARRHGAKIAVNGDVFDAVPAAPGDKRSGPYNEAKSFKVSADFQSERIRQAHKLLEPYADCIAWIGVGNHEEATINTAGIDLVGHLIRDLNHSLERQGSAHRIRHGGIGGYWLQRFAIGDGDKTTGAAHRLWYHHGTGGDAAVTKGLISVNRVSVNWDYDAMTCGHRHHNLAVDDAVMTVSDRGYLIKRKRKVILTGSYLENYRQGSQRDPLNYIYAESKLHAPKPMGGRYLILTPRRMRIGKAGNSLWYIDQDDATSLDVMGTK